MFFSVVRGQEDLAVLVEVVDQTFDGVGGVPHQDLRIAGAGEESSQKPEAKRQICGRPKAGAAGAELAESS